LFSSKFIVQLKNCNPQRLFQDTWQIYCLAQELQSSRIATQIAISRYIRIAILELNNKFVMYLEIAIW
jgi:hypothetical protein